MHWLIIFLLFLPLSLQAATNKAHKKSFVLNALIVCDDSSSSGLRTETRIDQANFDSLLKNVSKNTSLRLKKQTLKGKSTSIKNVQQWLEKVPIAPNQIILFYFAGHGFRTLHTHSPWPFCIFPYKQETLSTEWLLSQIYKKRPRLAIVLSDCCNNLLQDMKIKRRKPSRRTKRKKHHLPGLQSLFLETRGIVVASASTPGSPAFCFEREGGVFTHAFVRSIRAVSKRRHPSWEEISHMTKNLCSEIQHPIFFIQTKQPKKRSQPRPFY